jgi:excisionase family DNA binding protein
VKVEKAFYRVAEVQEILNMGRTKVYDLIRAGEIPTADIDGSKRVPVKQFEEWMQTKITSPGGKRSAESELKS